MQLKQFTDIAGCVQNIQLWQAMYRIFSSEKILFFANPRVHTAILMIVHVSTQVDKLKICNAVKLVTVW